MRPAGCRRLLLQVAMHLWRVHVKSGSIGGCQGSLELLFRSTYLIVYLIPTQYNCVQVEKKRIDTDVFGTVAACLWCVEVESGASGGIGEAETFQLSRLASATVHTSIN